MRTLFCNNQVEIIDKNWPIPWSVSGYTDQELEDAAEKALTAFKNASKKNAGTISPLSLDAEKITGLRGAVFSNRSKNYGGDGTMRVFVSILALDK